MAKAEEYGKVIIVTSDAHRNPSQAELVRNLMERCPSLIVVGSRTPYELSAFPEVTTYVAAYGSRPLVWDEVAKVLLGKTKALGKVPVSVE